MSKGSWFKSDFDFNGCPNPIKPASNKRQVDSDSSDEDNFKIVGATSSKSSYHSINWLSCFAPKEVPDLVVHPKKLEELRGWFKIPCAKVANKILLIEGPTGSAKTSALKLVAKESGFTVLEWVNTTDLELALLKENSENFKHNFVAYQNQLEKFTDFLLRSSRYDSFFGNNESRRLLVVKDLPNTLLKKPEEFWRILKIFCSEGSCPLVFILTETQAKSLNISFSLFPERLRMELQIDSISFNPISITMMKRGIKRIFQMIDEKTEYQEHFNKPTEETIDDLIAQGAGDIRHVILNLSFAAQQGNPKMMELKSAKTSKKKKTNKKQKKTDVRSDKDGGISLLHGVGRALYPKLEMNEETNLMELTHRPEDIAGTFSSQPGNFMRLVHSNYQKNFTDIDDVAKVSDMMSLSDCLESEYRDHQLSQVNLDFVIRSVMVLNKKPAPGFRTVNAYANKRWTKTEETSKEKLKSSRKFVNDGHMVAPSDFFCDYRHYMDVIKKI